MTTAASTSTTNSPRVLTPTANYFPHEGAALAKLSPNRSLKNAAIIYESIKNLPDETSVRGDFDRKSRPFIFFPEAAKEKEIQNLTTIASKNIEANRKEMHGFLSAIASDGACFKKSDIHLTKASLILRHNCTRTMNEHKDFVVGDIKESLKTLAKAYYADLLEKKTSPHRLMGKQVSRIQNKRLREFIKIPGNTALDICAALGKNYVSKYDTQPAIAFHVFKSTVKKFLNQDVTTSKSLANFLRQHAVEPDLQFFAKRWIAITLPTMTDERIQFSTEPWAKELDRICEIIVKSNRRSTQLKPIDTLDAEEASAQIVSQRSGSKPQALPKPDKVVYSSLNSEDTDDSSSFPSSPYQLSKTKSSSTSSASAAPLIPAKASDHWDFDFPENQAAGYLLNASEQEEMDSAQSTLSPTSVNKLNEALHEKFDYQSISASRRFLPIYESDEAVEHSERQPLLTDAPEESDQLIESSYEAEKM